MEKTHDITNISNTELKALLNISEEKEIVVSVDLLNGYFFLNYGHSFSKGTHKRFVKDTVDFIKKTVAEFGFKFATFKDSEIMWAGNSRGNVVFYTLVVEEI